MKGQEACDWIKPLKDRTVFLPRLHKREFSPPEVPEPTVSPDLLQPLQIFSQLVVQTVGEDLRRGGTLDEHHRRGLVKLVTSAAGSGVERLAVRFLLT